MDIHTDNIKDNQLLGLTIPTYSVRQIFRQNDTMLVVSLKNGSKVTSLFFLSFASRAALRSNGNQNRETAENGEQ
jgi:hypothetical protein